MPSSRDTVAPSVRRRVVSTLGNYLLRRLLQVVPVLFGVSVVVFGILRLVPGDPAEFLAGPSPTPEVLAAVRARFGLDQPIVVQYWRWLTSAVGGDFGVSTSSGYPVSALITQRLPATLELAAAGLVVALVGGVLFGAVSGLWSGSILDRVVQFFLSVLLATPAFWLGIIGIVVFAVHLGVLPAGATGDPTEPFVDKVRELVLPGLTLGVVEIPVIARVLRNSIVEVKRDDFVRTAYAKGIPTRWVVRRHVVKPALTPMINVAGVIAGQLLGGVVVVETVFNWPGLGSLLIQGIFHRDYAVVQACMLFVVCGFLLVNLVVDVICGLNDPRVRQ